MAHGGSTSKREKAFLKDLLKKTPRFADGLEDFKLALEQYDNEGDDDDDEENEDVPRYKIYHREA